MSRAIAIAVLLAACGETTTISLRDEWPAKVAGYQAVTDAWTRTTDLRGEYQEVLSLSATFKSPAWREAHAERDADNRMLKGEQRAQRIAQAQAEMTGPWEVEMMVTTWDRRENDLDHGKKSVWHVALVDEAGNEIAPLEIVRDKRPVYTLRAEFPAFGDFATAYVARFPRTSPVLGPDVHAVRLRMSSERGGVELTWAVP
jgi:hypothetical protein